MIVEIVERSAERAAGEWVKASGVAGTPEEVAQKVAKRAGELAGEEMSSSTGQQRIEALTQSLLAPAIPRPYQHLAKVVDGYATFAQLEQRFGQQPEFRDDLESLRADNLIVCTDNSWANCQPTPKGRELVATLANRGGGR